MQHLWLWMEKEILRYSFSFLSRDLRPRLYNTLLLETPKTLFFQKAFRVSSNEWKSNRFPNFFPRDDCFHIPKVDQKAKNVFITQSFLVSFTQPRPKKKVKATASFYSFYWLSRPQRPQRRDWGWRGSLSAAAAAVSWQQKYWGSPFEAPHILFLLSTGLKNGQDSPRRKKYGWIFRTWSSPTANSWLWYKQILLVC